MRRLKASRFFEQRLERRGVTPSISPAKTEFLLLLGSKGKQGAGTILYRCTLSPSSQLHCHSLEIQLCIKKGYAGTPILRACAAYAVAKARGWQGCRPCFPNGIPRRKYSEYYRHLGMHGKSATMKNWAA